MELVPATCPKCNKTININPHEEVVFCEACNKPIAVIDAIELHK